MSFTPKAASHYLGQMAYRAIARSGLRDLSPSSSLLQMLHAVSQQFASFDAKLMRMVLAFFIEGASGQLLDDRVAQMPGGGLVRQGASAATGSVVRLVRGTTDAALTVPAGLLLGRSDSSQVYRTLSDVTFALGQDTVTSVPVAALTPGRAGNAPAGTLARILTPGTDLIAASNLAPLTGGSDTESDEQLKARARDHLASLASAQPIALESAARAFQATDGTRARFAHLYEDPRRAGYSELIIDDGSGGAGGTRAMTPSTGTVSEGGALRLYHEAPLVEPVDIIHVQRGAQQLTLRASLGHFISQPERGTVWVLQEDLLEPGDVWTISTNEQGRAHSIYTGLVAQLQRHIEGDISQGAQVPGKRAAGTRVRVRPARSELLSLDIHLIPQPGVALADVSEAVKARVLLHLQALPPGATLYAAALTTELMTTTALRGVRLYRGGTRTVLEDITPSSPDRSLRSTAGMLRIIPAQEEQ